jgi:pimeloyl-ACP methyl ester carboxylesterase
MKITESGTPYSVEGQGPSLVFIHGVMMDHRSWQHQVDALSADFRVVCFDMIGHGCCPDRPGARSLDDFVAQTEDVIRHSCPNEAPVLVGFSMGGLIAQAHAIQYPSGLRGLVLMNAVYDRNPEERVSVQARLENLQQYGIEGVIKAARERWFRADENSAQGAEIAAILQWMRDGDPIAKTKAYRVFATEDYRTTGKLHQISCPALVMTGDGDKGSPPHMSEALASGIPNARLKILERQQHMMPVLAAEEVNAALKDFLRALSQA